MIQSFICIILIILVEMCVWAGPFFFSAHSYRTALFDAFFSRWMQIFSADLVFLFVLCWLPPFLCVLISIHMLILSKNSFECFFHPIASQMKGKKRKKKKNNRVIKDNETDCCLVKHSEWMGCNKFDFAGSAIEFLVLSSWAHFSFHCDDSGKRSKGNYVQINEILSDWWK